MVEAESTGKRKAEVVMVEMQDGRKVGFTGKRKVIKDTILDGDKIIIEGDTVTLQEGAVSVRMDFRNGQTRTFPLKISLIPKYAGHGGEQKFGDELAAQSDKPMSEEDMVLAVEDLHDQVNIQGNWFAVREGGSGFAGASIVVRAIAEASNKPLEVVKAFLQKKLDDAKARGEKLSRKELYDSFRNPNSKIGQIVKRMEDERLAKESKVDADSALAELG
jgi:hypothetical protein